MPLRHEPRANFPAQFLPSDPLQLIHTHLPVFPLHSLTPYTFFLKFIFFFFLIYLFLFLAALGLRCCTWAFSSCSEQGLLFIAVRRLLIAVASLAVEHRL